MRALGVVVVCALGCSDVTLIDARHDATTDAATMADGGVDLGFDAVPDAPPDAPTASTAYYSPERRHSPLSPSVAETLRDVRARAEDLNDDVFAKIGASTTVSRNFMHCFSGVSVDLGGREELRAVIAAFESGDAAGVSPFNRESVSATVGWHAGRALEGDPSPLEQEVEAILPSFAIALYGTNDINIVSLETYAENMLTLTDALLDRGVIPVLSSIMPRLDDASANAQVPRFNLAVRAIAQTRSVPFVDFRRELESLPGFGMGGDGIHPNAASSACDFSASGLEHGYNMRNLITIEALDRVRRVLVAGEAAPDEDDWLLEGMGTADNPFVIDRLPFFDVRNTLFSGERNLNPYGGCSAEQDESGPEIIYRLDVERSTSLWLRVFDRGATDVDIHLLDAISEEGCRVRAHREIEFTVEPGTHYVSVDTFVGPEERSGEYMLVIAAQ